MSKFAEFFVTGTVATVIALVIGVPLSFIAHFALGYAIARVLIAQN